MNDCKDCNRMDCRERGCLASISDDDPASKLAFLEQDIQHTIIAIKRFSPALVARIAALTQGVDVDLRAEIEGAVSALDTNDLAHYHDRGAVQQRLADLQEKFRTACWLLREAAEELGRIDYPDVNYPQNSIEHFLRENDK